MGKRSLRQIAYDAILDAIVNGRFPKGTVTSEGELCQMLDMSRTPIRAALQQLELEGFIRIAAKHGIIILDSSSERVGNLLEMVLSLALFAVHASWHSDREPLERLAAWKTEELHRLSSVSQPSPQALITFEFELLESLISLSNNEEMIKTFRTAANRLFWKHNVSRWRAPYAGETLQCLIALVDSLRMDSVRFQAALFSYLRILKRTWL